MRDIKKLELMADKLRIHSLKSTTRAGSGHPTTCLSCAEIMSCIFFSELQEDDEFILSKGHAAPILWAAYAEAGVIPKDELNNLRKIGSSLEGHPTPNFPWVRIATGSLGQGLSCGAGMALVKKKARVYVLMGDGECAEGAVWEAASVAAYYNLNNLCAIIDANRLGQSEQTMHGHDLEKYKKKFEAFGWNSVIVDGHNIPDILSAFELSRKSARPFVIIAKTVKGKGVSFLENMEGWHGRPLKQDELEKALKEIPDSDVRLKSRIKHKEADYDFNDFELNDYKRGEMVATRHAFGNALVSLGKKNRKVLVIDGDVKNSTQTEGFFKAFPERAFQCFIAEQNMVGMAAGISSLGFVPFVATFSAFLTRAHDFIRMAMYSKANLKFVGSHSGVSIGEDGPSQMGLEDIPMFLSMPGSVILYPCDAVSAEYLVKEMARHRGISYLRTTREKTPVIYRKGERFPIGGLKVLRESGNDKALVIAAGITVHEALEAYDILQKKGVNVRVIDIYSVQPVDAKALLKNADECHNNAIVVEDHYFGGIGPVVSGILGKIKHLYIKEIPRSGKPKELMKKYGIDASAIVASILPNMSKI